MSWKCRVGVCVAGALGLFGGSAASAQNLIIDPSFESVCTFDPFAGWSKVGGNNFANGDFPRTGTRVAFAYGGFFPGATAGDGCGTNGTGFQQDVVVSGIDGQTASASVYALNRGDDPLGVNVRVVARLEFFDSVGALLLQADSTDLPVATNVYQLQTVAAAAPVGTARVRIIALLEQKVDPAGDPASTNPINQSPCPGLDCANCPPGYTVYRGGSVRWDDASLSINGGPNVLVNPGFETVCTQPFFDWTGLGGTFIENNPADVRTGIRAHAVTGPYFFPYNTGGFLQNQPATAARRFKGTIWYKARAAEIPRADIDARLRLEFFDEFGENLDVPAGTLFENAAWQSADLASGTPRTTDAYPCGNQLTPSVDTTPIVWTQASTPSAISPAGTSTVRLVTLHLVPCYNGGVMLYDDASLVELCLGDHNGVGGVTVQDIYDFLTDWNTQFGQTGPGRSADFNRSNDVTVQDIYDFLSAWTAPCAL